MINSQSIMLLAKEYEFDECAIISAEPFLRYKKDLDYDKYGEDFNINYDPKECMSDATNIIVLIKSYSPFDEKYFTSDHIYVDSYYVTGNKSYFKAKEMTAHLCNEMKADGLTAIFSPKISYRHCAFRAGFGKRGRNGLLVNEKYGSYLHIQCIITNVPLEITRDEENIELCDECNKCNECFVACKSGALDGTGRVELEKCIRHYMPAKRYVPENIRAIVENSFIGCTDCRTVCSLNTHIRKIEPPKELLEACYIPILASSEHPLFKKHLKLLQNYLGKNEVRPLKLLKSIVIVIGNTKEKKYLDILEKLKGRTDDKDLLEYIDWAIEKIEKQNKGY